MAGRHVHTVTDGWEKLTAFLGHEVPTDPFPRSNSRSTRARTVTHISALFYTFFGTCSAVLALVLCAFAYARGVVARVSLVAAAAVVRSEPSSRLAFGVWFMPVLGPPLSLLVVPCPTDSYVSVCLIYNSYVALKFVVWNTVLAYRISNDAV